MSGTSLDTTLAGNVSNNLVAELAELRTDVFSGFEGAHADNCGADQVAVTRGIPYDQADEEESFVVDAVDGLAELLDVGQLFSAGAPVLVLVAAFDYTGRVGGVADDCPSVEDAIHVADHLAWSQVLGKVAGSVPSVVVGLVAEHDHAFDAWTIVVIGQGPVLAEGLVNGMHHVALVVAVDMDVRDTCESGRDEKGCKYEDFGKGDWCHG